MPNSSIHNRASPSATPNRSSRSGSCTESRRGSEPPVGRQQRMGSTVSVAPSHASQDEAIHSPIAASIEHHSSDRSPIFNPNPREIRPMPSQQRSPNWGEDQRSEQTSMQMPLPSLSDVLDRQRFGGGMHSANDVNGYRYPRDPMPSPGSLAGHQSSDSRPPLLKSEQSSSSSVSSYSHPRTPIDGQMPIHTLLAPKPEPGFEQNQPHHHQQQPHIYHGSPYPLDQKPTLTHPAPNGVGGLPAINGAPFHHPYPTNVLTWFPKVIIPNPHFHTRL